MTPEEQQALHYHAQEIAKILHRNAPKEAITNLEGIEKTVRGQILEHVSPDIAVFLSNRLQEQTEAENAESRAP